MYNLYVFLDGICVYIEGLVFFFLSKTEIGNLEQTGGNWYEWVRKGTGDRQPKSAVEGASGEVDLQQQSY